MDRRHVQVLYTDYARDKAKRHSRMSKGFDTKTVPCPSCAVPGIKAHTYTGTKVYMLNRRELYKDELGEGGGARIFNECQKQPLERRSWSKMARHCFNTVHYTICKSSDILKLLLRCFRGVMNAA
jgi:hypothetical protein